MFSKPLEAVVGANVAKESGLKLQDNFVGAHGFMHQGHSHDEFEYSVTGVLKPTGTIIDNLVLTPVESVWLVHSHIEEHQHDEEVHDTEHNHHEHVHENHNKKSEDKHLHEAAIDEILHKIENGEEISEEELHIYNKHKGILTEKEHHPEKEITSLLVFYQNPMAVARLPRMINENTTLQAASPALEFNRLLSLLGYGITVLEILAWIIIIISGINIFIYLLNTINQSIGEIALLRATGVSRPRVFMLILMQGALLSVLGWLIGVSLAGIIWQIMPWNNSVNIFAAVLIQKDLILLIYCIIVAIMAGVVPAIKIYNTKIHYLLSR
jgi:putative ABC transport system permease protein